MKKYSRQRELILRTLDENRVHPSAETVYELIRKKIPNISLATVYRNLNMLSDTGVIRRLEGVDGIFRFDGDNTEHHHFVCNICGNIIDIPSDMIPEIKSQVSTSSGLVIDSYDVTFKGICDKCTIKN